MALLLSSPRDYELPDTYSKEVSDGIEKIVQFLLASVFVSKHESSNNVPSKLRLSSYVLCLRKHLQTLNSAGSIPSDPGTTHHLLVNRVKSDVYNIFLLNSGIYTKYFLPLFECFCSVIQSEENARFATLKQTQSFPVCQVKWIL